MSFNFMSFSPGAEERFAVPQFVSIGVKKLRLFTG